jgi:hypothetical protein
VPRIGGRARRGFTKPISERIKQGVRDSPPKIFTNAAALTHNRFMAKHNSNRVSLAGEFAVLSQLALKSYDANMTLGHTKAVDILVSDPDAKNGRMYKLEVKTNHRSIRKKPKLSKVHGRTVSEWIMHKKHEELKNLDLFYCFVNIGKPTDGTSTNEFKFYVVPSAVVARYVKEEHALWLRARKRKRKKPKDNDMRMFRLGVRGQKYAISTPIAEKYENNWSFEK